MWQRLSRRLRARFGLVVVLLAASSLVAIDGNADKSADGKADKNKSKKKAKPGKPAAKASRESAKDLEIAVALLNAGKIDLAIAKLEAMVEKYPEDDSAAVQAASLLIDCGVGDEARVILIDRKVFRQGFKIREIDVLALAEATIEELQPYFKDVKPFFEKRQLKLTFYDSQASYRQAGGGVTAGGHFAMAKVDYKARSLQGEIEWYLPKHAATLKDRQLRIKSTLYHETAHYWNAICFGGALPSLFNEGIAMYLQSRLQKEYYQYYRTTDRLEMESDARNALNSILKYEDFEAFLQGERGFGQGGEMISRWYGLCYAVCDFFEEGTLNQRRPTFAAMLGKISSIVGAAVTGTRAGERPRRVDARTLLEALVADLHGSSLQAFHKALVQQILSKYKQR